MKKLIFDFDGTLVDSMPYYAKGILSILDKRGITYPDNLIKIITPLGFLGTADYYLQEFKLDVRKDALVEEIYKTMENEYFYHIPAKETVKETLLSLKARGYSLNVLTASPHRTLDVCLKRVGLFDAFDNIWSCDDFGTTKADVNIYHAVAKKLNTVTENCVFLDDNVNALTVAKQAGMQVIGVYDESSKEYQAELKELSSQYIYKFSELIL